MTEFLSELRRRNVIRMAGLYLVGAWLVVQVAETVLPAFDVPGWVLRAIIIVLALGFVPAVVFSWVYELTPDGLKRDGEVTPEQSIAASTGRRMDRLILVGLAAVIALVAADRYWPREATAPGASVPGAGAVATASQSGLVAVLPFRNRSVREEDAFFAEGIHDDLLTQLSKIASLKVISRTSMQRYADSDKSVPEIARELGAAVVLEGAVQRSGDQVRITVQLIDGASDVHLWAETYDRELTADTLFAIQADIARVITESLQVVLTPAEAATLAAGSTRNIEAYEAFLQGKLLSQYDRMSSERLVQAIARFDQAIALDPGFADAYARKARTQLAGYWYSHAISAWRDEARDSLAQARRLAPESTETWLAEAYDHYWGDLDYVRAEAALARVLARSPEHVEAWLARAFVARRDGRFEDSIAAFRRALEIDPVNIEAMLDYSIVLAQRGGFAEAEGLLGRAASLGADTSGHAINLALHRGDPEAAWAAVDGANETWLNYPSSAALRTRDPEKIALSLSPELWPESLRSPVAHPEAYALAQAQGWLLSGDAARARLELEAIRSRLQARDVPYPGGWSANTLYWPSLLPGLLGDLDGVRAAERDYQQNAPRDVFASIDIRRELAIAFARAGDPESALGHLEAVALLTGPAGWLRFSIEPGLESVHQHPRWLAMKANYERWAAEQAP
jgi:TolB-like protein/tetratricopeptide (TPR) repeat protein